MRCYEVFPNPDRSIYVMDGLWTDGFGIGLDGRSLSLCKHDRPDVQGNRIFWARLKHVRPKNNAPEFYVLTKPLRKDHKGRWLNQDLDRGVLVLLNVPYQSYDLKDYKEPWLETPGGTLVVIREGQRVKVGDYHLANEGGDLYLTFEVVEDAA